MTRWSLFLQTLSLLHHFLGFYSEKAWEAVSHYVNSVARQRNWPLGSHRRLIENANKLISVDPANASHKRRLLRSIEALHANFYRWGTQGVSLPAQRP